MHLLTKPYPALQTISPLPLSAPYTPRTGPLPASCTSLVLLHTLWGHSTTAQPRGLGPFLAPPSAGNEARAPYSSPAALPSSLQCASTLRRLCTRRVHSLVFRPCPAATAATGAGAAGKPSGARRKVHFRRAVLRQLGNGRAPRSSQSSQRSKHSLTRK